MLKNNLLLRTIRKENVERPPVWLMRQAGRILPEYRAVRSSLSGFVELVRTPEKAAEVTVQPVDILGVDAAIIFSDILVVPESMGLPYELIEKKGPRFPDTIKSIEDVNKLIAGEEAAERLGYVYKALEITKELLNDRVPLIGFAGAPWTLLAYMIEGQGSKTFSKAKSFLYKDPELAHALLEKLTKTIIAYLKMKVRYGADVIQLFDSWAGLLNATTYKEFCLPYLKRIVDSINEVPVIIFAKGAWFSLDDLSHIGADVIGLDWSMDPGRFRDIISIDHTVQGNLDPCILYGSEELIKQRTHQMIEAFGKYHICNLGHGVYPDTPLSGVKCFIETVKSYRY